MKRLTLLAIVLTCATTLFAEDPATFTVSAFTFQRPTDWKWVATASSMRKAQLSVPGETPEKSAEVTFFHFGGGGMGGVDANIKRWLGQFKSPEGVSKTETQEIGGSKVTIVTTEGTYSSGMPGGPTTPMENFALLGAIIEHADGEVFVKMTGPATLVKESRKKFMDLITSGLGKK